jgi:hypothetical protein
MYVQVYNVNYRDAVEIDEIAADIREGSVVLVRTT